MGAIARAVKSRRFLEALQLMTKVWDGDVEAAAYTLAEVFNVDVDLVYPLVTARLP